MKKRLFSFILIVSLMFSIFPVSSLAAALSAEGTHGDNISWSVSADGVLTISGIGKITEVTEYPWSLYAEIVTTCVIEEGVTNIPYGMFRNFSSLEHITIPVSLISISGAFHGCTSLKTVQYNGPSSSWRDVFIADTSVNDVLRSSEVTALGDALFDGGDGSAGNPYQIKTAQQLDQVRTALSGHFIQMNDIDLCEISWIPIGSDDNQFSGSYDGNGYAIHNLNITDEHDVRDIGMWGVLSTKGHLKNIHLNQCNITIGDSTICKSDTLFIFIGGLVGYSEGSIEGCSIEGTISVSSYHDSIAHRLTVGGISGKGFCSNCINNADITVINLSGTNSGNTVSTSCGGITGSSGAAYCVNYGDISVSNTDFLCLGGISGEPHKSGIDFCVNYGSISGTTIKSRYFSDFRLCSTGGIAGTTRGSIEDCINYGAVRSYSKLGGSTSAGGIAGGADLGAIRNCYNLAHTVDAIGQTKVEYDDGTEDYVDKKVDAVGRILGYNRGITSENNYSLDTTLVNDEFPDTEIGATKNNGADRSWENIIIASAYILTAIENPMSNIESFDRYVYQANSLLRVSHSTIETVQENLHKDTYCEILVASLQENGFHIATNLWDGCELISKCFDDITELGSFLVEPKDIYLALILNTLEEDINSEIQLIDSEYKKMVKYASDFVSVVKTGMETAYSIDIMNAEVYQNLTAEQTETLQNLSKDYFKTQWAEIAEIGDVFGGINTGIKIAGNIEDFYERLISYVLVSSLSDSVRTVVEQAYSESAKCGDLYLQLALSECVYIMNSSCERLAAKLSSEGLTVVGKEAISYLVGEIFWNGVKASVINANPVVAVIQAAYKNGVILSNGLSNTDKITEQYIKMLAMVSVERVFNAAHDTLCAKFVSTQTPSAARAYLSAVDILFQLRINDCTEAYTFVHEVDNAVIDSICSTLAQILGHDYSQRKEDLKSAIETRRGLYSASRFDAHTVWVDMLLEDYPGSGLYETYHALLPSIQKQLMTKKYLIACPVDVYVYDEYDNMVAYVSNGRASNSLDLTVVVDGDQKTLWFHDTGDYRIEYVGNDTGEMDISVTEYDETDAVVRSVNLYDIPLEAGTAYAMTADTQNASVPSYDLAAGEDTILSPNYDSAAADSEQYVLTVESGSLIQNGESLRSANVSVNESVTVTAYVPTGYRFLYWEASDRTAVFENAKEVSTTVRMTSHDLTICPVIEEIGSNGFQVSVEEADEVISIQLTNKNTSESNVFCIAGMYNTDGSMLTAISAEESLKAGAQIELSLDDSERNKPAVIKVFVLDASTLIPLRAVWIRIVY